jgi:hypothetical protein
LIVFLAPLSADDAEGERPSWLDFKEQKEGHMALRDDIHRDYPHQVTLPLDDKLVGVLDWLDHRVGRWHMYVDLRDQTIRYCFRDLPEASAFSRRFDALSASCRSPPD